MSWDSWERSAKRGPMRITVRSIGCLVIVAITLTAVGFGAKWLFFPARIVDRVLDPDRALYTYEWFHQTYQDVGAIDRKIASAVAVAEAASGTGFQAQTERARLNSVVLGLRNQRDDLVAMYNARAAMASRNLFLDGDLPDRLKP